MINTFIPSGPIADAVKSGELPSRVWLYSNYHCNLACSYCLTESAPRSKRRELTSDQMIAVAEQARELGFGALGITGGEPFLLPWLPDTVLQMVRHLPVLINTNGTLFVGDRIERATRLAHPDIALQISLDSHLPEINDEARGPENFAHVVRAVPILVAAGVKVRIATTTSENLDCPTLDPLKRLVVELGVSADEHIIRPIVRRGRADEINLGVHATARDIPNELTIGADGAFWGSFGPTVRNGRLDTDLLLTRTILPLSVPANALLTAVRGQPAGTVTGLGIRCA